MSSAGTFVIAIVACLISCSGAASSDPAGICVKSIPMTQNSTVNLLGDWLVLYSSNIRTRNGASYWGGDLPYDFCDPFNLNSGCMAVGYTLLADNGTDQTGYAYSFNAFTDVWTIEQMTNSMYNVPGTNLVGFRTTYKHYVQVENTTVFANGSPVACGNRVLRSGPIYRSASYVMLTAASDYSWAVLLYCDSFYGLIDNSAPLLQVVIKKDVVDKCSYPFNSLFFYKEIKQALIKNKINVYASDFKLVYHDDGGVYPVAVNWKSIQWDADCVCAA